MRFATALAGGRPLLADGAAATTLFAAGLPVGTPPERWVIERPDAITALHAHFAEAGADILLTATFGASHHRLAGLGLDGMVGAVNAAAVRLARAAAAAGGRDLLVAGSIGPVADRPGRPGWTSVAAITAAWTEQAMILEVAGVDALWFETLSTREEMHAAAQAAARTGLPFVLTACFPGDGRTLGGLTPHDVVAVLETLDHRPSAFGANCGSGPAAMLPLIEAFAAARTGLPLIAKPSAGLPTLTGGALVYPISPADMAAFVGAASARGASIIGGCCGTGPAQLAAMRRAIDELLLAS